MRAILLIDHGSRLEAANAQLEEVALLVAQQAGNGALVAHAHMELAEPSIEAAIDTLVAAGATDLVVVPYFLAPGKHATRDIPRLAREAAAKHAALQLRTAEPLGVHELLARLVLVRANQSRPTP